MVADLPVAILIHLCKDALRDVQDGDALRGLPLGERRLLAWPWAALLVPEGILELLDANVPRVVLVVLICVCAREAESAARA